MGNNWKTCFAERGRGFGEGNVWVRISTFPATPPKQKTNRPALKKPGTFRTGSEEGRETSNIASNKSEQEVYVKSTGKEQLHEKKREERASGGMWWGVSRLRKEDDKKSKGGSNRVLISAKGNKSQLFLPREKKKKK